MTLRVERLTPGEIVEDQHGTLWEVEAVVPRPVVHLRCLKGGGYVRAEQRQLEDFRRPDCSERA